MKYPQITLSEWTQVGEGYNGQAFVSDAHPGVLLKLVRREMGAARKVEQEFYASKAAFELGIPTPQVYGIVRDGADHPERIPGYAAMMAEYGHMLLPYAVLDVIRTFHLHTRENPALLDFLRTWIEDALSRA